MGHLKYFLGVDIGGTVIKTVVLSQQGQIIERDETPTADHNNTPDHWKEKVKEIVDEQTRELTQNRSALVQIGISAPGLVDERHKRILLMPERLEGIEDFDFTRELDREVWVINDGHAACLAEYESYYKQKGILNMLMLTLGTGVGGGVIMDGSIYSGHLQRAGHFGHMTINHHGAHTMTNMVGSLENAIGNFSVRQRTNGKYESTKELVEAFQKGSALASYWWLSSVQQLATALASLINIMAPECVVVGGGIAGGAKESLFHPLNEFLSLYEWRPNNEVVPVYPARFGIYAGAIGAAFFAKSKSQ